MKRLCLCASIVYFLFTSTGDVSAQIVINEISPGTSPEWVELYKTSEGELGLDGCVLYLHNDLDTTQKVDLAAEIFTTEQKYKQITWSSSWLNNGGDTVVLVCPWGSDQVSFGSDVDGRTYGRSPDASENLNILEQSTPSSENSSFKPTSTPAATSTPTPTLAPTPTPTPTESPSPTLMPTKKLSPTPTTKPSPTFLASPNPTPQVLGVATSTPMVVDLNSTDAHSEQTVPNLAIIMITLGLAFILFAGWSVWKKYHETT